LTIYKEPQALKLVALFYAHTSTISLLIIESMIKLKHLLLENPDTVVYNNKSYSYTSNHNRSAFLVYYDTESKRENYFGYDRDTNKFYSNDADVISDVEQLENLPRNEAPYATDIIKSIRRGKQGGGHQDLWEILQELRRDDRWPENRGRFFEVPDDTRPSGEVTIMTFWSNKENAAKYKDMWDKMCGELRLNPKEILYNPGSRIMTHDEFYDTGKQDKPVSTGGSSPVSMYGLGTTGETLKVGDTVKVTGLGTYSPIGSIVSMGNNGKVARIKIIDNNNFDSVRVGSEIEFPTNTLNKVAAPTTPVPVPVPDTGELDQMIREKEELYSQKSADLHVTGATLTPAQKRQLQIEVDKLAAEIEYLDAAKKMATSLNISMKRDDVFVVNGMKIAVDRAMEKRDHGQKYDLNAELERVFPNMSIAQIRQKFSHLGIPLRKMVKEVMTHYLRKKNL
jgi:hypothetical protein